MHEYNFVRQYGYIHRHISGYNTHTLIFSIILINDNNNNAH